MYNFKQFFTKKNIKNSFLGWILIVAITPLLIMTYFSYFISEKSLQTQVIRNLSTIANNKAESIENFIYRNKENVMLLAQNPFIINIVKNYMSDPLKNNMGDINVYLKYVFEKGNYKDIIIFSPNNQIFFSMSHRQLTSDALLKVIDDAKTSLETQISNVIFEKTTQEPLFYIASPILEGYKMLGVIVVQINFQNIINVVNNSDSLDETGETIVGIVSDGHIQPMVPPKNASLTAFSNIINTNKNFLSIFEKATQGEKGQDIITDYRGLKVLAVWQYLPTLAWGMLVKENVEEAFEPIQNLKINIILLVIATLVSVLLIAYFVALKLQKTEISLQNKNISLQQEMEKTSLLGEQLVTTARQAGKAEVATSILHNVGNILNSVNVSANLLIEQLDQIKISRLSETAKILKEHRHELEEFITNDPQGKHLIAYVEELSKLWEDKKSLSLSEIKKIENNIQHIKDIINMQQTFGGSIGLIQEVPLTNIIEDALNLNHAIFSRVKVKIINEYSSDLIIFTDKVKLLQILVNLIRNACETVLENNSQDKKVIIRVIRQDNAHVCIQTIDNGLGILKENITNIFSYGFTTKKTGHGFGLHTSALLAREIGGSLTAESEGINKGATFSLVLPIKHIQKRE